MILFAYGTRSYEAQGKAGELTINTSACLFEKELDALYWMYSK